jgi:hypothetical protein
VANKRKAFFPEEKNQKAFANSGVGAACKVRDSVVKVFCFFSSEKKTFLVSVAAVAHGGA